MTFTILAPAVAASQRSRGFMEPLSVQDTGSLEHATLKQPIEFSMQEYNTNATLRASVDSKLQEMQDYKQSKGLLWIKVTITDSKKSTYAETGLYNGYEFGPDKSKPTHFGVFFNSTPRALMLPENGRIKIEHYKARPKEIKYQNEIITGSKSIGDMLRSMHRWHGSIGE